MPRCCGGEEGTEQPSAEGAPGVPARRLGRRFEQSWASHLAAVALVLGSAGAFLLLPRALQNSGCSVPRDAGRMFAPLQRPAAVLLGTRSARVKWLWQNLFALKKKMFLGLVTLEERLCPKGSAASSGPTCSGASAAPRVCLPQGAWSLLGFAPPSAPWETSVPMCPVQNIALALQELWIRKNKLGKGLEAVC